MKRYTYDMDHGMWYDQEGYYPPKDIVLIPESEARMPLTGQDLHFANQIDGLLERVDRIERFLGGRWKIADATRHVHDFKGPMGASKYLKGAVAEAVCQCGAEIVRPFGQ